MFLSATLVKPPDGGWFPLVIGAVMFTLMSTWWRGRHLVRRKSNEGAAFEGLCRIGGRFGHSSRGRYRRIP